MCRPLLGSSNLSHASLAAVRPRCPHARSPRHSCLSLSQQQPKAAAPEAAAPAPTLAPTPAPAPFKPRETPKPKAPEPAKQEVKKQEVKKQAAPSKPGKRRGPLPLWFAEILALGAYVGLFLAVTKYSQQSSDVLRAVADKVVEAYKALDKLINKNKQQAA